MPQKQRPEEKSRKAGEPVGLDKTETDDASAPDPEIAIELPIEDGDANAQTV